MNTLFGILLGVVTFPVIALLWPFIKPFLTTVWKAINWYFDQLDHLAKVFAPKEQK